ncbi:MAG: hypothetical protein GX823_02420, partial [Clostridiales bacterium]|nr:hypothetical protein [Clostridiales bacterium]
MLVKRYHAKDMQKAMDQIIRELGSDAVILSSRKVREKGFKNLFKRKVLEVMAAYDPGLVPGAKPPEPPPVVQKPDISEEALRAAEISKEQFARLDKRIDDLTDMLNDFVAKFAFIKREVTYDYPKEIEELFCSLVEGQVREELAHTIARETDAILQKQPDTPAVEIMEQVLTEQLGIPA